MPKSNIQCFITYEESLPINRLCDYLTAQHFAAIISPEHKDDVWTPQQCVDWRKSQGSLREVLIADDAEFWACPTGEMVPNEFGKPVPETVIKRVPQPGDLKKSHRHCLIRLDYSAVFSTWKNLLAPLDVDYCEPVHSYRKYVRYMCHLDNPEKTKYDPSDVINLGGLDISCLYEKTDRDREYIELRILNTIAKFKCKDVTMLQNILYYETQDTEAYFEVKAHFGYWNNYMSKVNHDPDNTSRYHIEVKSADRHGVVINAKSLGKKEGEDEEVA